jgi:hypothetical protein
MDFDFRKFICGNNRNKYLPGWVCKKSHPQGCFGNITLPKRPESTENDSVEPDTQKEENHEANKYDEITLCGGK